MGLIPGLGRSPGGGRGNPLQFSCLENPMDRGAWWAHSPQAHKESDRNEATQQACRHTNYSFSLFLYVHTGHQIIIIFIIFYLSKLYFFPQSPCDLFYPFERFRGEKRGTIWSQNGALLVRLQGKNLVSLAIYIYIIPNSARRLRPNLLGFKSRTSDSRIYIIDHHRHPVWMTSHEC